MSDLSRSAGQLMRVCLAIAMTCAVVPPAMSEEANAYLVLDSFSFFFDGGIEAGGAVPATQIPVHVAAAGANGWTISIQPSQLSLPSIALPDGTHVAWSLLSPALGNVTFSGDSGQVQLAGEFKAQSLNSTRSAIHTLAFTTGTSTLVVGNSSVSRTGIPMDRGSGYLQLVATSADPPGSEHGAPFYVVISGRFSGTPLNFLNP